MNIYASDILFLILLAFGVHIYLVKEVKLSVKFGAMDHRNNISNPIAQFYVLNYSYLQSLPKCNTG